MKKPELTVGVCAYNEEKNIGALISKILEQKLNFAILKEVIVVSSGSNDNTDAIVRRFMEADKRVKFIREAERIGKVSAVNIILSQASGDIIALVGADLQFEDGMLEILCQKFIDENVGMVGARPMPVNDKRTLPGFCSYLLWELHHQISLQSPKCGEVIAFRNRGYTIPKDISADEAYLESRFKDDGFRLAYAEKAIVFNRGPETIWDYIKQRRRVHAQHMYLRKSVGYKVSTSGFTKIIGAFASSIKPEIRWFVYSPVAIALEATSFVAGAFDFYIRKDKHIIWEVVESTKEIR